jgi:hypothetical protein
MCLSYAPFKRPGKKDDNRESRDRVAAINAERETAWSRVSATPPRPPPSSAPPSAMLQTPTTPTHGYTFQPMHSSPLAFPASSPVSSASASTSVATRDTRGRRQSQYKSLASARAPVTPPSARRMPSVPMTAPGALSAPAPARRPSTEAPQTAFLRERFRARCAERAVRARADAVAAKRYASSEPGSSDVEMDEDSDEDAFLEDEVRRCLRDASLYAEQADSSSAGSWRAATENAYTTTSCRMSRRSEAVSIPTWRTLPGGKLSSVRSFTLSPFVSFTFCDPLAHFPAAAPNDDAPVPEDFDDDADLAALVEEYQECEDWEQLADQIFAVSDDEVAPSTPKMASARASTRDADVDMA